MRVTLDEKGNLTVVAETITEAHALSSEVVRSRQIVVDCSILDSPIPGGAVLVDRI